MSKVLCKVHVHQDRIRQHAVAEGSSGTMTSINERLLSRSNTVNWVTLFPVSPRGLD